MKKLRTKQAVICFIGVAVCKLGFAGCYPFIPAYFAAAYLERGGRLLLGIGMFLGMAAVFFRIEVPDFAAADTDDKICNDTAGNHSNHQAGRMGK